MHNVSNDKNRAVQARFGVLVTMLAKERDAAEVRMLSGDLDDLERYTAATEVQVYGRILDWAAIS